VRRIHRLAVLPLCRRQVLMPVLVIRINRPKEFQQSRIDRRVGRLRRRAQRPAQRQRGRERDR
jgi:hypothetical protein